LLPAHSHFVPTKLWAFGLFGCSPPFLQEIKAADSSNAVITAKEKYLFIKFFIYLVNNYFAKIVIFFDILLFYTFKF